MNENKKIKSETGEFSELHPDYKKALDENVIVSIADASGIIIYVNKVFSKVYQWKKSEVIGKNHRIINSGYHDKKFYKDLWSTIVAGKVWRGEIRNKAKDGSFHWADAKIVPVKNSKGKVIQFIAFRFIITDKKLREAEREEYNIALEKMLFMTNHRVRKPVTTCLGLMQQLEHKEELNLKEQEIIFKHMKTSANELDELTRELTLFLYNLEIKKGHGKR